MIRKIAKPLWLQQRKIQAPIVTREKPIRKEPEFEPHGESYGESHWKCFRIGKAKSDVSTPEKTKKTPSRSKKSTNRANAEYVLDPIGRKRMYNRNDHKEKRRFVRIAGATPLQSHAKKPRRLLIRVGWSKRSTADDKSNLENAL